jgi:rhomboid protease GluP
MSNVEARLSQISPDGAAPAAVGSAGVTVVLLAANVLMFVLMAIMGVGIFSASMEGILKWGANYGPLTLGGQWWRMLSSLFLHFGLIHLLCNMLVLANIGTFMERLMGSGPYLVLYLVAGLGGEAASLAWHPTTASVGASGAIFGLYGALLAFLLRYRNEVSIEALGPLRKGALVFVGYSVLYGLFRPEIDMAAHLGGLAAGFTVGLFLVQPRSQEEGSGLGGRSLAAILLGAVTVIVTLAGVPQPDDLQGELKRLSEVETKALATYNASLDKWKANQLTDQQFIATLENEILSKWRAEREALAKMSRLSKDQVQLASSLARYMAAREESWELLAEGVRTDDMDKIKRSGEKSKEAERLAEKLDSSDKK